MSNSFQIYYVPNGKPQTYTLPISGVHKFSLVNVDINYDTLSPAIALQLNSPQLLLKYSAENIPNTSAFYSTHSAIQAGPVLIYPYSNTSGALNRDMTFQADFSGGFTLQILNFYYGYDAQGYGLFSAVITFTLLD
jgi:hypothetical protein